MTYLTHPAHYAPEEFRTLLQGLKFDKGWKPQFPTLHNTGVPSLKQWLGYGAVPQARWGAALNAYYKGLGWHAGPHLVVCPDYVWNLCDLEADGVSVSCWNRLTLGIEMVGNYEEGADDFASGRGAKVRDNAVFVLAALCEKFGWDIGKTLRFHRECPADHHACPGSRVAKVEIVQRVNALLQSWSAMRARSLPGMSGTSSELGATPAAPVDLATVAGVQRALNSLGYWVQVDNELGPQTEAAVRSSTKSAILRELARD